MIIILQPDVAPTQLECILTRVHELGLKPLLSRGHSRTILGVIGEETRLREDSFSSLPGVESVIPILKPFKLASKDFFAGETIVRVGEVKIGGGALAMVAG